MRRTGAPVKLETRSAEDPLDVLARLDALLREDLEVEDLVRPLLDLTAALTGFETVYLTRIDWDRSVQELQVTHNVSGDFVVPEGLEVDWDDTLCRRSMDEGLSFNTEVPLTWPSQAASQLGIQSYASAPVQVEVGEAPYGTLCGASPRRMERDERITATLHLFARIIGTAIAQRHDFDAIQARAVAADRRLAERIEFAAKVEHAMRTPLGILTGWADTLVDGRLDGPAVEEANLVMQRTARRLQAQVADLLEESRLAVAVAVPERIDVRRLADQTVQSMSDHPVTVSGDLVLVIDPTVIGVLLEHLVENAIAHTPAGTAVRVLLEATTTGGRLVVEDDGPGLPPRDDLFEPFVSADPTAEVPGTGLGLHIVKELVEHLGGTVASGASSSGGARFEVALPGRRPAPEV
jgi:signal transduction histidine kinase